MLDGRIKSRMSPKFKKHKLNPNIDRKFVRSDIKYTKKLENFDANMLNKRRKLLNENVTELTEEGDVSTANICRPKKCGTKCVEMESCGYVLVKLSCIH